MDYPNDFNVPAFPAGKTVALARSVSIWISIVFFLIVTACGFLLLDIHFRKNFPFLISINPITEDWTVMAYPEEKEKPIPQHEYIQEKLVHDFVKDWFTISDDENINKDIWAQCSKDECKSPLQFNPMNKFCAIACKSAHAVFEDFEKKVIPNYQARITQAGEKWSILPRRILINKIFTSEKSSKWQVYTAIHSSLQGDFDVLIFIDVERDADLYPATFGYYINQFNSYRITNE